MQRIFIKDTPQHIEENITLYGWVRTRRDHGQIIFIDLWDATGFLQCVLSPDQKEAYAKGNTLRTEWVVAFTGKVQKRPPKMVNEKIITGSIEFVVQKVDILNEAQELPLDLKSNGLAIKEDLRLQYRYLDLRRERLQEILKKRAQAQNWLRNFLTKRQFTEIETPVLTKSTPEGARDFVVPSRLHPGSFYALPQSPQQYKQLLMIAGFDRYFQFPHVFRDEDLRADRLFEHTQLDIEMSFIEQEDILNLIEEMIIEMSEKVFEKKILTKPFPRLSYQEAMKKYSTDRPDLRQDKKNEALAYTWIVDFPMFEKLEDGSFDAVHHPFTAMQDEDLKVFNKMDPQNVDEKELFNIKAKQYDLVLNGTEVMGGSIRTHRPDILQKVFQILGHNKKNVKDKFGHLLEAFKYGTPPHGGIAAGFDRLVQTILGEKSIRETVAFPTNTSGRTSVMNAPSKIDKKQLQELGIETIDDED
jgi:aspartyl-tRNA synthetase